MEEQLTAGGALTKRELEEFSHRALLSFARAAEHAGRYVSTCSVGGVRIDLEYAGTALRDAFSPALAGLQTNDGTTASSRILIFDAVETGVAAPEFDRPIQHLIRWRGDCWANSDAACRLVFHYSDYTLQIFDPASSDCVVVVNDLNRLPSWVIAAPLRTPLAMVLQHHGLQFVHGAAVGDESGAVLVTGYGGAGKSTTALSCLKAGFNILGDDYVAIRPPIRATELPTVHNIYSSLKIHLHELEGNAGSSSKNKKAILFPFTGKESQLTREAPLRAVLLARIGEGRKTHIIGANPSEVARIAYASTGLQIPGDDKAAAQAIEECVAASGAHVISLGSDRTGVAEAISDFLEATPRPIIGSAPAVWDNKSALKPVSVIVPVHNGACFITEAISSVADQLYPDIEVIVVDDGSTDDLDEALSRACMPYRLIRQPQRGPAAARNAGIRASSGAWIAFLDVDDLWVPGGLKQLSRDLLLHGGAGLVHGKAITFRQAERGEGQINAFHPRENYPFYIGAGLYRRSSFETVGLFDETLTFAEDTDWYWRANELIQTIEIPEVVLKVRMHGGNMTANLRQAQLGAFDAMKRLMTRRRQATTMPSIALVQNKW